LKANIGAMLAKTRLMPKVRGLSLGIKERHSSAGHFSALPRLQLFSCPFNYSMTTRRTLLQTGAVASLSLLDLQSLLAAEGVPQSVVELWADFDPRKDPLEVEVIHEW